MSKLRHIFAAAAWSSGGVAIILARAGVTYSVHNGQEQATQCDSPGGVTNLTRRCILKRIRQGAASTGPKAESNDSDFLDWLRLIFNRF